MDSVKRVKKEEKEENMSTRTICITKIASKEENTQIKEYIKSVASVFEMYSLDESVYTILFVIFYELSASEKVFALLSDQGKSVIYTISKYEIPRSVDKCDENKNQGTLLVMGKNLSEILDENELMALFGTFGTVMSIKDYKPFQKYVEFDDTRKAVDAYNGINNSAYKDGALSLKFSWDIPLNVRWAMIKRVDEVLKNVAVLKEEVKEEKSKIYYKNVFLKALDDFIVENLSSIEKWF